jgi:hypothetical protein
MAEYSKKKYYWIKLTDHFLTSETVDFLLSQKDGANYVVLYQIICLKCVNTGGELARKIGEIIIPFDIDKIARDSKHFSVDTVRVALELYKSLGLIYEQENGILKISDFYRLVGSQTEGAMKKELQKNNRENTLKLDGGIKVENFPPDIKILDTRDKDTRDKENKDIKENAEDKPRLAHAKHKYGSYKNVLLTEKEIDTLRRDYTNADDAIEYLSEYIEMKGYKAKSHYLAIKKWVFSALEEQRVKNNKFNEKSQNNISNFTQRNYSKNDLDKMFKNVHTTDDIDI